MFERYPIVRLSPSRKPDRGACQAAQIRIDLDYQQLLRHGYLRRLLPNDAHERWRRELRRRARQDRLRIRTGAGPTGTNIVWATLPDWELTDNERANELERLSGLGQPGAHTDTPDVV